jgi:hypothetical protein
MKKHGLSVIVLAAWIASPAGAAELSMAWQGQSADERVLELEVGQNAVIDISITVSDGDSLSTVFYVNEPVPTVTQVGAVAVLRGWTVGGTNAVLGDGMQQFAVASNDAADILNGPDSRLVGSQGIHLDDGTAGQELEITFAEEGLGLLDGSGAAYSLVATSSPSADEPGFFHLGVGSPGYAKLGIQDERDPLILRIVTSGGGGGGGGGTDPDDGNDNADDDTNDNSDGDTNDNADDDDTNDNGDDAVVDGNQNDGADDPDDTPDNTNDAVDNDNGGTPDGGGGSSGIGCGVGMIGFVIPTLLGMWWMQFHRRRR